GFGRSPVALNRSSKSHGSVLLFGNVWGRARAAAIAFANGLHGDMPVVPRGGLGAELLCPLRCIRAGCARVRAGGRTGARTGQQRSAFAALGGGAKAAGRGELVACRMAGGAG